MVAPNDWEVRYSNSRKRAYFYSAATKESIWEPPAGMSEEDIMKLPGAQHLHGAASGGGGLGGAMSQSAPEGKVRASHLLIKHSGSRRPSSWKEATVTRSKEEALSILSSHQEALTSATPGDMPNKFAALAQEHSDCSSHTHGGDLGAFGRGQMQKPFEDATFGLQVNELSGPIETESGVHLILRTA